MYLGQKKYTSQIEVSRTTPLFSWKMQPQCCQLKTTINLSNYDQNTTLDPKIRPKLNHFGQLVVYMTMVV